MATSKRTPKTKKPTKAQLIERIQAFTPEADAKKLKRLTLAKLQAELTKLEEMPVAAIVPVAVVAPPVAALAPVVTRESAALGLIRTMIGLAMVMVRPAMGRLA
jgi:hypothetical protein